MEWQEEFVKFIHADFNSRKEKKPGYSLRAYATRLGLSSGALSDLLNQKANWRISSERAFEILEKLPMKPKARNLLLVRMGIAPQHQKEQLKEENFQVLTDWTYLPILFSFDLPLPLRVPAVIAKKLGVPESKVNEVIEDLIGRTMLERTEAGTVQRPEVFLSTANHPPAAREVMFKHHEVNLDMAKKALREQATEKRDFTSLTFAGSQTQIDFLRTEIRKVYEKASSLTTLENEPDTVYRLSVQLFPMEFNS